VEIGGGGGGDSGGLQACTRTRVYITTATCRFVTFPVFYVGSNFKREGNMFFRNVGEPPHVTIRHHIPHDLNPQPQMLTSAQHKRFFISLGFRDVA
jgi:hypothetical protein